jgi:RNA polymerase sigma-70 factor (ECF subfamily)
MLGARRVEMDDGPSDAVLAQQLAADDEAAFRQLYRRYVVRVRSTLVRLGDATQIDDTTQEVFLRVWRSRAQLREAQSVSGWIYRIAVNVAMDQLRSRKHVSQREIADDDLVGEPQQGHHETREAIVAALETLDFAHRAALVLHDLEELTDTEVGEALGIPRGTVKSRLHHARRRVREFLQQRGIKP